MAKREHHIFKIKLTNFLEHNSQLKKGHKATLISNNFCEDAKLRIVPLAVRWMFLDIILMCGDQTRDTIEMTERQLRDVLESSWSVPRALDALQELQLLTYEKITPFIIEMNRKEENRKETNITVVEKSTQVMAEVSEISVIKNSEVNPRDEFELVSLLPTETKARWARLYPSEEFLHRELIKAFGYYRINPKKLPRTTRGWSQALSSWFERGWKHFVRTIPGEKAEVSQDYWDKVFGSHAV